jgi:type II secretory pathway component PulF
VSIVEAIRLTAEVAGNWYFEQAWLRVLEQITEGRRICDSMQDDKDLFRRRSCR